MQRCFITSKSIANEYYKKWIFSICKLMNCLIQKFIRLNIDFLHIKYLLNKTMSFELFFSIVLHLFFILRQMSILSVYKKLLNLFARHCHFGGRSVKAKTRFNSCLKALFEHHGKTTEKSRSTWQQSFLF